MTIAKLPVPDHYPSYRSKSEVDWSIFGNMILFDELKEGTAVQLYEPITFNLPGGKYTPDFMHLLSDGRMAFVEVKASKKQGSYRSSRTKQLAAAEQHPWYTFIQAVGKGESWEVEVLK